MGPYLSKANKEKNTDSSDNQRLQYASCEMQGIFKFLNIKNYIILIIWNIKCIIIK